MIEAAITELAPDVGVAEACRLLGAPRSSYYRRQRQTVPPATGSCSEQAAVGLPADGEAAEATPPAPRARSPRALSSEERAQVKAVLNSERFADCAPREVYATLLDEGTYLCSWPTMYRILRETDEVRRRRDQVRQSSYSRPELLATRPKELWSWDITKLKGPATWTYYYLYVILDVYSRFVVGWMIAERETAELAEAFIAETCAQQGIAPGELTLHADRGSAMTSKCVAHLLADLGVVKTHSRPQVSNDNPYSEAQFKTVKYHPSSPERFGSVEDARAWARGLFIWYNEEHHHTGLGLLTPATVHHGQAAEVLGARQEVLRGAYQAHPERFVRGEPRPGKVPGAVWINPPAQGQATLPPKFDAGAEPTVGGQPPVVAVSSGVTAQRPLDTATREAMLPTACSVPRQTNRTLHEFQPNLSHRA